MAATFTSAEAKQLLKESNEATGQVAAGNVKVEVSMPLPLSARHPAHRSYLIAGATLAAVGLLGIFIVLMVQYRLTHYPTHQHVVVVEVKSDVVEAALIRRANPAVRKQHAPTVDDTAEQTTTTTASNDTSTTTSAPAGSSNQLHHVIDSIVMGACGRRGGDLQHMIESCINELVPLLPKKSGASLLFVLSGREILKQWAGCNITSVAKHVGDIAEEIAHKRQPRLRLADDGDQGVRLVDAKEQAISSFIGANRQHLEKISSTGVIGIDSKSAYLAYSFRPPEGVASYSSQTGTPLFSEQIAGHQVDAYSEAFYCFGIEEFWRIYLGSLLGNNPAQHLAKDPCAPAELLYSVPWSEIWHTPCRESLLRSQQRPQVCPDDEENYRQIARVDFTGSGNLQECKTRLTALLRTAKDVSSPGSYSGHKIPKSPQGEFVFFDGSGSIARAFEFAFRYRENGPVSGTIETVLDGRDLYLGDVATAVHDFCSKQLDPKAMRKAFGISTTRLENEGAGPNSDFALRRTCFDAYYGIELLASLGFSRGGMDDNPVNHIVLARPPAADINLGNNSASSTTEKPPAAESDHSHGSQHSSSSSPSSSHSRHHVGLHHSDHKTAEWLIGYLETGAAITGDFRKVRPLSTIAFAILLAVLAICIVVGAILLIIYALRIKKTAPRRL